jgi:predicted extracellular nuclease
MMTGRHRDDFTNLIASFQGVRHSYTFDGQAGYLDHALANASLAGTPARNGTSTPMNRMCWTTTPFAAGQEAPRPTLSSSDHDPVVVGLTYSTSASAGSTRRSTTHRSSTR